MAKANRNNPAYWEQRLCMEGLSMNAGNCGRVSYMGQLDFEVWLSMEGTTPDIMDVIEYRQDHLEAA